MWTQIVCPAFASGQLRPVQLSGSLIAEILPAPFPFLSVHQLSLQFFLQVHLWYDMPLPFQRNLSYAELDIYVNTFEILP